MKRRSHGKAELPGREQGVDRVLERRGEERVSGGGGGVDGRECVGALRAKPLEASALSALHGLSVWLRASLIRVDEQRRMFSL